VSEKRKDIVLNLAGLHYLDSSGIGELVRNYLTVIKSGGTMKVVGLSAKVEEILKITQLYKVFPGISRRRNRAKEFSPNFRQKVRSVRFIPGKLFANYRP